MPDPDKKKGNKQRLLKGTKGVWVAAIPALIAAVGAFIVAKVSAEAKIESAIKAKEEAFAEALSENAAVGRLILRESDKKSLKVPGSLIRALRKSLPTSSLRKDASTKEVLRHSDVGWYLFLLGSTEQAIEIQQESLNLLNPHSYEAATVKKRLAEMIHKQGRSQSAIELLEDVCVIYAKGRDCGAERMKTVAASNTELPTDHLEELAEILNDIGLAYRGKEDFPTAKSYYEASDAFVLRLPPDSSAAEQHAWNQNGLGLISLRLYYERGERAFLLAAKKHFAEAAGAFRKYTGSHPLASVANHQALIAYLENDYKRSVEYLKLASQIWKDQLGPLSPDVALAYDNLARAYAAWAKTQTGRFAKEYNDEASKWRGAAEAAREFRSRGFDIRVQRHEAVYSSDGKNEWHEALKRREPTTKSR